jgi:MFS family permease
VTAAAGWPVSHWMGLSIHGWQWMLMLVAVPGIVIAVLLFLAKEPPRRGVVGQGKPLPAKAVIREISARRGIYLPMFVGLALSASQTFGLQAWRTPFILRTYGWNEAQIGRWMGLIFLISSLMGAFLGTLFVEWLSKHYKDANLRASALLFALAAPCEIIAPLMPSAFLAMLCIGAAGVCGLASAVPQNAAIQRITPNELRGQVTAIYLFMFIAFGALGSQMIGSVTQRVFHAESDLWKSLVLTASITMPLAALIISLGIKPYGREVERLEALESKHQLP